MNEGKECQLRMNAVTFIDDDGKVRLTLSTTDDGKPYIAILNPTGEVSALFGVTVDQEPYITRTK